ncbi:hypothetical protein ES319_A05G331800v1 [Gossypium barbadense]|uniref:HAT C-terminal dimerisation domain-containing protein n=1 Tax=Gossypium barbadense TaxID=3634 RepID=A0A5J5VY01_GOSBA|nr:hypothetical protein ES319_A05G331800v1 [Gossypium barbadense]
MASSNTPIPVDDEFNEYESALKCQKSTTSKVWDEMIKLKCENKNELKAQYNHFNNDITQYTIATQPSLGGGPSIKKLQDISRFTTARDVLMYYAKERDHVKEELAKAPSIDNKIFSITLGNASYNDVMVSCLKNCFRTNRAILCDGAFFQVRCCAHIFNLISKASLELADDVIGKIRNGIKYIKKSGIRRKIFYDVADKSFHLNVTKKLHQDVLDYWGKRDKDYQIFALSNEEWRNVHKVLLDTFKGPYSFLTPMVKQMLNYVQYCFTTIYGIHASDFVETILSNLKLLLDEYVRKSKSTSSSLAESSNVSNKDPDSSLHQHNNDDYKWYLNESSTKSEKLQLDIYLEESELDLNSQIDVLDYWSKSSVRYNELSLLACDLLAIPISTVASESAFSMGKKVITPFRSSLKPKMMRAKGFSTKIGCKNDDDDEDDVSSIAF